MLFQEDFGLGTKLQNPLGTIGNILFNKVYLTTVYAIVIYIVLSVILYKTKLLLLLFDVIVAIIDGIATHIPLITAIIIPSVISTSFYACSISELSSGVKA